MNRYDPEIVQLLAERGKIGPRLIRGLIWAVLLAFVASILVFLLRFPMGYSFDITNIL